MANVRMIRRWLLIVCGLVVFMVLFGGYVRLTRSGLSIVEWNVITGIVPPTSEADWQAEFAKYQESPEFEHVNADMTLSEYKFIFYNEYIHRLVARFAGLIVVLPFFWFLAKGIIPWRKSAIYWVVVILFGLQGAMGWYMVSSGLVDRPAVSHYRLTAHLLLALLLLSIAFLQWLHLDNRRAWHASGLLWVAGLVVGLIIIQISYGGLVAGLKAGYVSDTWPLMYGAWLPAGIFSALDPWWRNLVEALPAELAARLLSVAAAESLPLEIGGRRYLGQRQRIDSRSGGTGWLLTFLPLSLAATGSPSETAPGAIPPRIH